MLSELRLEQLDLLLHHAKGNGAKERAAQWQALLGGKGRHGATRRRLELRPRTD